MPFAERAYDASQGPWARIVVVAFRSGEHLQSCIDALAQQTMPCFEVVIVDNACPDRSTDSVQLPDPRFNIHVSRTNRGFSGGSNLGASGAETEWLVTLNPDAAPCPTWLAELKEASLRSPDFDVLSSTLIQSENTELLDGFGDVMSIYGMAWRGGYGQRLAELPTTDQPVFGACGAAACYRRRKFEEIGGFDESFFCYLEDIDLAFRFQSAGLKCLQVRQALVRHHGSASSSGDTWFPLFQTYKNSLRLILRNAPGPILPVMLLSFVLAQAYINLRNVHKPESRIRVSGLLSSFKTIPSAITSRKDARANSKRGTIAMLKCFASSPLALRNQKIFTIKGHF
ncbi:MAG: glycosyltransferase family 2 protein [Henriciella sp.]|nr:glycosyltransferase family 2 protein [Henriciella sp.]